MRNGLRTYLERCVALMVVAGIATFGTWLIGALLCLVRKCVEDEASRRADALIGDLVVAAYVILTWIAVFLPAVGLRRKFSTLAAAATPAAVVAVGLAYLLFDSEYDDLASAAGFFLWLTAPWVIANLAGLAIWPAPEAGSAANDIDCFE